MFIYCARVNRKLNLDVSLPPAYVVRREGNVLTRVCPSIHLSVHRGGVPISHNALQQFPECHGADTGGVPYLVPPGPGRGGTLPGGGTQVGQQKEYSLHGGRYASCVHAGGLSCLNIYFIHLSNFLRTVSRGEVEHSVSS